MISDLKRLYLKLAVAGMSEHDDAITRAIKANDIGQARELVGRRDGIQEAIDYLDEAFKQLDTEDDDDDGEAKADKDELAKGDRKHGTKN